MHQLRTAIRLAMLGAIVTIIAAAAPTNAEAQQITACYSKKSGSMYRVGQPNTPADCGNGATKETWNVQGAEGPQGPAGPQGLPGQNGVSGYEIVEHTKPIGPGASFIWQAVCPEGKMPVGGGAFPVNFGDLITIHGSGPSYFEVAGRWSWQAKVTTAEVGKIVEVTVYAVCVSVN